MIVTSFSLVVKVESTSNSIKLISSSVNELVTDLEISNVAISPVREGAAVGILVVGGGIS